MTSQNETAGSARVRNKVVALEADTRATRAIAHRARVVQVLDNVNIKMNLMTVCSVDMHGNIVDFIHFN